MKINEQHIVAAIKHSLARCKEIRPTQVLVKSLYFVLKAYYIDDKRYVMLEAPTGSGKSIIGMMLHFSANYLECIINGQDLSHSHAALTYYLTSSKMLQEQLNTDIDRFKFEKDITILKGVDNYPCDNTKGVNGLTYKTRYCYGVEKRNSNPEFECFVRCAYENARLEASGKSCTIFNYHYFLNVRRSEFNPYFADRNLTICDEAHLLPNIVCGFANFDLNPSLVNKIRNINEYIGDKDLSLLIDRCHRFFESSLTELNNERISMIICDYFEDLDSARSRLNTIKSESKDDYTKLKILSVMEDVGTFLARKDDLMEIFKRVDDLYVTSIIVSKEDKNFGYKSYYKHEVKDLSEAANVKKHFINKCDRILFMSATMGDMDEYAKLVGVEEPNYEKLKVPSVFPYDKSPIFICKSGWLNYKNFASNIDEVLNSALKICRTRSDKKGIIHTATFRINDMLKNKVADSPDKERYLFYTTSEEKELAVGKMKNSSYPYVIIGPSLYEGLDLKYDQGRFNILIKVPYAELNVYVKRKIERYPFWYERDAKEKTKQAIGRTDRDHDDWSETFLLDNCFEKIIWNVGEEIDKRIKYTKIY